jgi:putative LysE/RhtB family amino acid efflux pump
MVFAVGFVIMAPIGPVSTVCIRRTLLYGPRAGSVAGAGAALAVALYAIIGVTGSALVIRFFAPFATLWHIAVAAILVAVAVLIWRAKPELPNVDTSKRAVLAGGFGAALAMTLANPGDIVLFAAIFAGLGVAVHTPLDDLLFCATIFAGGCVYWIALALLLDRWRAGLTAGHIRWLNRGSALLMGAAAAATLASLARPN